MQEFNCLDPHLSLAGEIFLEASAGTGKTFAIEHIVLRLIISGISFDKILITTFTKAGVRDLKMRIYENFLAALKNPPPYLSLENRDALFLKIKNALRLIDEANIYTIHSFCYRMLSEYAFEAGIEMELQTGEELEVSQNIKMHILDTLRTLFDQDEFSPAQLYSLLKPFDRNLDAFIKKMSTLLKSEPSFAAFSPYSVYKEKFTSIISLLNREEILDLLPLYKKTTTRNKEIHREILLQVDALLEGNLEYLIKNSPTFLSLLEKENEKKEGVPHDKFPHYKQLITLKGIVEEASHPHLLFLRVAKKIDERCKQNKAESSPNFLLHLMQEKLKIAPFKELVQKKYEAVIIDEFQDTDPLQWDIFHELYFKKTKLFLVVGDPKQSIYGFRGADLATFLRAKEAFTHIYSLKTNYRSEPRLLSLLNQLFDQKNVPDLFTFDDPSLVLSYENVATGIKKEESNDKSALLFVFAEDVEGKIVSKKVEETTFFPYIAKEIVRIKGEDGYSFSDFAILVKDRFQAERTHAFLQSQGLPSRCLNAESIVEGRVFSLLELAFTLMQTPKDLNLLKQFLAHPIMGTPLEHLEQGFDNPFIAKGAGNFIALKEIYENKGLPAAIDYFGKIPFHEIPFLESLVLQKEDYSDYIQIIHLLLTRDKESIIDFFKEMRNLDIEEHPHLRRISLLEDEAIQIMTTHMSKGLEFPVVFALGIASRHGIKRDFLKTKEGKYIVFSPDDPECQKAIFMQDQEKLRLLYVACTRAKSRLYIMTPFTKEQKEVALGNASPLELFLARSKTKKMSYKETYEAIPKISFETVDLPSILLEKELLALDKQIALSPNIVPPTSITVKSPMKHFVSFSSLAEKIQSEGYEKILPKENELPIGSLTGHIFHLIFEKLIDEGRYSPWEEKSIRQVIHREIAGTHLAPFTEEVYSLIHTGFHTPLSPSFALIDVDPSCMLQEMSFLYRIDEKNTYVKGFADLVFMHEGLYYILDWKMNTLADYTYTSLDDAMKKNSYYLQASLYEEALRRYLKITDSRDFDTLFGGTLYFFLRGKREGLLHFFPKTIEEKNLLVY